jgi:8-oxo-dGTP diphosphatase
LRYQIAVLCYLSDAQGRVLLLRRSRPPNKGLYSPIGGKLDQASGESPTSCALREIREETGLELAASDLHLTGIVSEAAYEGHTNWLMFLFEAMRPVRVERMEFDEGVLEWHPPQDVDTLAIPETDRQIIWPLFWQYRGRFFAAHIQCADSGRLAWTLQQPAQDAHGVDGGCPTAVGSVQRGPGLPGVPGLPGA